MPKKAKELIGTIKRQLAHVSQNRIRSAYNRVQYWEERVKLME